MLSSLEMLGNEVGADDLLVRVAVCDNDYVFKGFDVHFLNIEGIS